MTGYGASPCFVFGALRSGTTLFRLMLKEAECANQAVRIKRANMLALVIVQV
jgi:hypothetical protein